VPVAVTRPESSPALFHSAFASIEPLKMAGPARTPEPTRTRPPTPVERYPSPAGASFAARNSLSLRSWSSSVNPLNRVTLRNRARRYSRNTPAIPYTVSGTIRNALSGSRARVSSRRNSSRRTSSVMPTRT